MKSSNESDIWNEYHDRMKELEGFENENNITKKLIVTAIRDSVHKLQQLNLLPIKENQISSYIKNLLLDRGITVAEGYWSGLFPDNMKRNYTNPNADKYHTHRWITQLKAVSGNVWELCGCGKSRINGILQESVSNPEMVKPDRLHEIITPKGIEFEALDLMETIAKNNIKIIHLIRQKTSMNMTNINKQHTNPDKIHKIQLNVNRRIKIYKKSITAWRDPKELMKWFNHTISTQLQAIKYFDDRASMTYWEKIMSYLAGEIGYDMNSIAKMLNVTSKHMKLHVITDETKDSYMQYLDWFGKCPGCGMRLKDLAETMIKQFKTNKPRPQITGMEAEGLTLNTWQKQVITLKRENQKLLSKLHK